MLRIPHTLGRCLALAGGLTVAVAFAGAVASAIWGGESRAADTQPVRIAVFEFELDDRSAGGSVIEPDAADAEHLKLSTEEARRLLARSGRYQIVEAGDAMEALRAAGGVRHCNGCESALAGQLGAEQSLAGLLTRITRTEYTLQIVVRDTATGAVLANGFTGLRMGANYAWPRGTRWLVNNSILK